jgi:pimeloyl-ACP methyl ester carboxylesterase
MLYSKTTGHHPQHIIFLHGNSQSHQVWDAVVNDGALKNYTKVAADLPGHGQSFRSQHPEKDYTLRGMAQYVQDFANQYSKQGYILVASSLATNYIAEKAHGFENCKGVFLTGACIIGENIMPDEIIKPNPNFPPTFAADPDDADLTALMNDEAYHVTPQLLNQLKAMYHDTDPNLRVQLGASIAKQEYGDEIGNLWKQSLPIAVVYGADDKLIYPDYMETLGLKMWKDQIIKIPKTGHCLHLDEPKLLAGMIAEFAAECFK